MNNPEWVVTIAPVPLARLYFVKVRMSRYRITRVHIAGESWRVYVHVCTCLRRRPVEFSEISERAGSAQSPGISQFLRNPYGRVWNSQERILTNRPRSRPSSGYVSTSHPVALSSEKGTYSCRILAGVHPCLHMSSRGPGVIFGDAEISTSSGIFAFWGILRCVLRFIERILTTPLWMSAFKTSQLVALPIEKGAYFWRILAGAHPCLGGRVDFRKAREVPGFSQFSEIGIWDFITF